MSKTHQRRDTRPQYLLKELTISGTLILMSGDRDTIEAARVQRLRQAEAAGLAGRDMPRLKIKKG
jgi:hypothetical protein